MTLRSHLTALEASGLIRLAQAQPELEYLFRHTLIQEAAYASLLKADRRKLHCAVGEALEQLHPGQLEEWAETLAYHFERGEDWPRALRWLVRASDRAFARYSLREAQALYQRSLACLPRVTESAQVEFHVRLKLAECLTRTGADPQDILALLTRCLELAPDAGRRAEAHFRIGQLFHIFLGRDLAVAEKHYGEALHSLKEAGAPELYGTVLANLGYLYRYQGEWARSAETLEQALRLASQIGSLPLTAETLIFISGAYLSLNREDEALAAGERALKIAAALGNLELTGRAHSFLSEVYIERARAGRGEAEAALPHLREMQRYGREYGVTILGAFGADGLGEYFELKRDGSAAAQAHAESGRIWRAAGLAFRAVAPLAESGRLYLRAGQSEAAEAAFAQAQADGHERAGWTELRIARARALAGQTARACAQIEHGLSLAPSAEERERWLVLLQTHPDWQDMSGLPGIAELLARLAPRPVEGRTSA